MLETKQQREQVRCLISDQNPTDLWSSNCPINYWPQALYSSPSLGIMQHWQGEKFQILQSDENLYELFCKQSFFFSIYSIIPDLRK